MSSPAELLTEIRRLSGLIHKQQRDADEGRFKSLGAALGLQRLRRDRAALQRQLPALRVATINGVQI